MQLFGCKVQLKYDETERINAVNMVFTIPSLLHFLLLSFLCSRKCSRKWPKGDCQNMGLCRQAIRYIQKKNRC